MQGRVSGWVDVGEGVRVGKARPGPAKGGGGEGKSFSGSKPLHSLKVQSEGVGVLLLRFWDPSCRDSGRPRFVDSAIGVV